MLTEKDYCDYETRNELIRLGYPAHMYDNTEVDKILGAILLYEVQTWLREEKSILILPEYSSFGWSCGIHYLINSVKMFKYTAKEGNSFEDALSEGIKEAVKLLKEN